MLFMLKKQGPLPLIVSCLCQNGATDFCSSSSCAGTLGEARFDAVLYWPAKRQPC